MRPIPQTARLLLAAALIANAQSDIRFGSNVPLVVVPITVTDSNGNPVEGLTERDLILYDNNVPQKIRVDETTTPISLALVLQSSFQPLLDKLRDLGSMLDPLITGNGGDAALITFRSNVTVEQTFTTDVQLVANKLEILHAAGFGAASMDAVMEAVELFKAKPPDKRRRVILLIGEASDRGSKVKAGEALFQVAQENITVYSLTFSRWLMPFTARPNADLPRGALVGEGGCEQDPEQYRAPPVDAPGVKPSINKPSTAWRRGIECNKADLLALFGELKRATSPKASSMLASYTGGASDGVLRKRGLEEALERIGRELHTQYVVTFTPTRARTLSFHTIRAEVKGRADYTVRTRAGYWGIPE